MSLTFDLRHRAGSFSLEVRAELGEGLTALVGPSGAGKTTLLQIVAGLLRPVHAVVHLDGDVLADTPARVWRAPHQRRIGYVFQEPRLLPHLTVRQNLVYGRWWRRGRGDAPPAAEVIDLLNLGALLGRYPSRLSGGEKQRVALGRALLAHPRLLLLDEPLVAVDQPHREDILPYLDHIRRAHTIPAVYVTHTWNDVRSRADAVLRLEAGRLVDGGGAAASAPQPARDWTRLVGPRP